MGGTMRRLCGLIIGGGFWALLSISAVFAQDSAVRIPEGGLDAAHYYGSEHKRFLDRDQLLYLGRGIGSENGTFYFLQMNDLLRVKIIAPWQAYMKERNDLHYHSLERKKLSEQFKVGDLVYYDQGARQAGFILEDSWPPEGKPKRTFLLHWDFEKKAVTRATLLGRKLSDEYLRFIPVGNHWPSDSVYVARSTAFGRGKGALREVDILRVTRDKVTVVASIKPKKYLYRRFAFDSERQRVFLAEYGEKHEKPKPNGYFIDLVSGEIRTTQVPFTPMD